MELFFANAITDVLEIMSDRFIKKCGILKDCCELLAVALERKVIDILSIDTDMSRARLIKSHQELCDSRFTTTSMSYEGDTFSFLYLEVYLREDFAWTRWIGKRYFFEMDMFFHRLELDSTSIFLVSHEEYGFHLLIVGDVYHHGLVRLEDCHDRTVESICECEKKKKRTKRHTAIIDEHDADRED
jgi:hypothetical protein